MSSIPTARAIESPVVSIRGVDFSYAPGERQILGGLQMEFRRKARPMSSIAQSIHLCANF
ncbi:MAG: hypothetical protein EBY94_08350 [Burkholderiaceae bacterium]|nr:hypothetical protein [Burkholderiaceae bacterium]